MEKKELTQTLFDAVNGNEVFCKSLLAAEDAASAQKVLNENGFDVTKEDVEAIFVDGLNEILKFKESATVDELSVGQLDNVAGGGFLKGALRTVASAAAGFGFGVVCGVCPAASAATPWVVGGLAAWSTAGYLKKGW